MKPSAPVGVFDSGIGGLSILQALRAELPHEDFVYLADSAHAPYGERDDSYLIERARAIIRHLRERHQIKALVVACNTATAAAIALLRQEHPDLPIVGVEPALKPAAASPGRRIGVMATRATLASAKFKTLLASLQTQADFICQPCDGLARAIENDDDAETRALCQRYVAQIVHSGPIDTLVLGCTHYPFAAPQITPLLAPGVQLIDSGAPVARQTRRLLAAAGQLATAPSEGRVQLAASGQTATLQAACLRWLHLTCRVQHCDI